MKTNVQTDQLEHNRSGGNSVIAAGFGAIAGFLLARNASGSGSSLVTTTPESDPIFSPTPVPQTNTTQVVPNQSNLILRTSQIKRLIFGDDEYYVPSFDVWFLIHICPKLQQISWLKENGKYALWDGTSTALTASIEEVTRRILCTSYNNFMSAKVTTTYSNYQAATALDDTPFGLPLGAVEARYEMPLPIGDGLRELTMAVNSFLTHDLNFETGGAVSGTSVSERLLQSSNNPKGSIFDVLFQKDVIIENSFSQFTEILKIHEFMRTKPCILAQNRVDESFASGVGNPDESYFLHHQRVKTLLSNVYFEGLGLT